VCGTVLLDRARRPGTEEAAATSRIPSDLDGEPPGAASRPDDVRRFLVCEPGEPLRARLLAKATITGCVDSAIAHRTCRVTLSVRLMAYQGGRPTRPIHVIANQDLGPDETCFSFDVERGGDHIVSVRQHVSDHELYLDSTQFDLAPQQSLDLGRLTSSTHSIEVLPRLVDADGAELEGAEVPLGLVVRDMSYGHAREISFGATITVDGGPILIRGLRGGLHGLDIVRRPHLKGGLTLEGAGHLQRDVDTRSSGPIEWDAVVR